VRHPASIADGGQIRANHIWIKKLFCTEDICVILFETKSFSSNFGVPFVRENFPPIIYA